MKKVIILSGLPASGKSTWANKIIKENPGAYKRVNKDDLRSMLDSGKYSKGNESFVINMRDMMIAMALQEGKHVIVDDTNLNPIHEEKIRELVRGKAQVEVKFFNTPIKECIERDMKREKMVGQNVISDMHTRWLADSEESAEVEKYIPNNENPKAVIFDIDGTLAIKGNRSPYEWSRVGEDQVNTPIKNLVDNYRAGNYEVIIFTGRDGVCEKETKDWLTDNEIWYDYFDMRPEGSTEKDSIVKKRMFDKIKDKYCIEAVIDDRKQVKKMWVSLGLFVLDVNQHDEIF